VAFPALLMKQLYFCDSVVTALFVGTGCSMGSCGWLLGRRGYGIIHRCPFYPFFLLYGNMKIKRYIQNYTFACFSVRALNELCLSNYGNNTGW